MKLREYFAPGALILILAGLFMLSGCGGSSSTNTQSAPDPNAAEISPAGDIPDNQAFVAFSPPGTNYSVKVPEGWSKTASSGSTTFTDKLNSITISDKPASSPPTVSSVQAEIPQLSSNIPGFKSPKATTVTRSAGDAVLLTYNATAKKDPVTGKSGTNAVERYTFYRNGEAVVLTLTGPEGADNVDPWMLVSDSLSWNP